MTTHMILPWITPEEEEYDNADEGTIAHRSEFAPGLAQFQSYSEPRLKISRRHVVRDVEMGTLAAALRSAKGAYEGLYSRVHRPRRGSFPTGELLANPYFANGTTDWTSSNANLTLSVNDRVLRALRVGVAANYTISPGVATTVSGAAYVARVYALDGKGVMDYRIQLGTTANGAEIAADAADYTTGGVRQLSGLASSTTTYLSILDGISSRSAGDYQEFAYISLSRCFLVNGGSQTGNTLIVDKLPASTNGLLLKDDPIEINGELKFCTAPLNSDSSGNGYLRFAPALFRAPADNDPVIVHFPMMRGSMTNYKERSKFGLQLDISYDLEQVYV